MAPPSSPAVALIASSGYSVDTQDRRLHNHIDNRVPHPRRRTRYATLAGVAKQLGRSQKQYLDEVVVVARLTAVSGQHG